MLILLHTTSYFIIGRFGVSVYRQYFPKIQLEQDPGRVVQYQPGHVLTIVPPVRVENLLPIDITYYFCNTDICRVLKPGVRQPVISVSIQTDCNINCPFFSRPTEDNFFYIAHTHPLRGIDVPFGVYDF